MKIGSIGCHYQHGSNFYIDRPEGTGCGVMLLLKAPVRFIINGVETVSSKNAFVIFTPETPYRYGSEQPYTHDWVYFDYEEGDAERLSKLEIPLNEVISVTNAEELSQILRQVSYEHHSFGENRESIEAHYMEIFFLKLNQNIKTNFLSNPLSLTDKRYFFQHLRNKIYGLPEEMTGVAVVVKQSGMSYSGFQHMYKKIFGVSVMDDIIRSRFLRAEKLLLTTNMNIKSVAHNCGYISEYSFMRKFKEIYGMTPTEYRKTSNH